MTEREQAIAELLYLKHDCLEGSATYQTLDKAIALLKAQEPRVMTLEELENAEVAYAEDKDKTDIIPVLVLGRMCEHVALVKPHVDEEAITRMIIPRADEYGVRWRCWTSRPTDAQRNGVKWSG